MIRSKKDSEIASVLRQGMQSDFWQIICKELDINIARLTDEIDDMSNVPVAEYKGIAETFKAKKQHLKDLKALPERMIEGFEEPSQENGRDDIYSTADDFLAKKKN